MELSFGSLYLSLGAIYALYLLHELVSDKKNPADARILSEMLRRNFLLLVMVFLFFTFGWLFIWFGALFRTLRSRKK